MFSSLAQAELRRPTLSSAMAQPSATYSKKPALPPDDMWAEDEDASARARQSTGATLSKRQRSKRGAAANYSGGLDQAALQAKLQAYFGERAKHMQVMSIADVDDDDDTHDGLLAYGGVAASQKAAKQLLDENTGDLQPARRDKPLPADDVEWEYADAGDAWRSW